MIPVSLQTNYTTASSSVTYYVTDGESEIFRGRAFKAPDELLLTIELNEIAKFHLHSNIPDIWNNNSGSFTMTDAAKTFSVYYEDNTLWGSTRLYNDWSYSSSASTLSNPANSKVATNMYKFNTTVNGSEEIVTSYSKQTANACGDFALYYVNLRSGVDQLLFEGKCLESKNMEQFDYSTKENHRFQTNLNLNWELNTGWLSDAESKILYDNLFTSNILYLHNLVTNKIYPVHIVDTSVTKKEFLNERSLISYKINVEYDRTLYRR